MLVILGAGLAMRDQPHVALRCRTVRNGSVSAPWAHFSRPTVLLGKLGAPLLHLGRWLTPRPRRSAHSFTALVHQVTPPNIGVRSLPQPWALLVSDRLSARPFLAPKLIYKTPRSHLRYAWSPSVSVSTDSEVAGADNFFDSLVNFISRFHMAQGVGSIG